MSVQLVAWALRSRRTGSAHPEDGAGRARERVQPSHRQVLPQRAAHLPGGTEAGPTAVKNALRAPRRPRARSAAQGAGARTDRSAPTSTRSRT